MRRRKKKESEEDVSITSVRSITSITSITTDWEEFTSTSANKIFLLLNLLRLRVGVKWTQII